MRRLARSAVSILVLVAGPARAQVVRHPPPLHPELPGPSVPRKAPAPDITGTLGPSIVEFSRVAGTCLYPDPVARTLRYRIDPRSPDGAFVSRVAILRELTTAPARRSCPARLPARVVHDSAIESIEMTLTLDSDRRSRRGPFAVRPRVSRRIGRTANYQPLTFPTMTQFSSLSANWHANS